MRLKLELNIIENDKNLFDKYLQATNILNFEHNIINIDKNNVYYTNIGGIDEECYIGHMSIKEYEKKNPGWKNPTRKQKQHITYH